MPMYNLLECSNNYSMTSDEVNGDASENNDADNYRINCNETTTSKFFEYKAKIIGTTPAADNILDTEVVVPLKH